MKRYEHFCSLDGGGMGEPQETADGGWVRYEDAIAEVALERERIAAWLEVQRNDIPATGAEFAAALRAHRA